jgi:hypothetical protein
MTKKLYSALVLGGVALVAGCGDDSTDKTQQPQTGAGGSAGAGAMSGSGGTNGSGGSNAAGSTGTGGGEPECCPAECWTKPCNCTNGICCWLNPSLPRCQTRC